MTYLRYCWVCRGWVPGDHGHTRKQLKAAMDKIVKQARGDHGRGTVRKG